MRRAPSRYTPPPLPAVLFSSRPLPVSPTWPPLPTNSPPPSAAALDPMRAESSILTEHFPDVYAPPPFFPALLRTAAALPASRKTAPETVEPVEPAHDPQATMPTSVAMAPPKLPAALPSSRAPPVIETFEPSEAKIAPPHDSPTRDEGVAEFWDKRADPDTRSCTGAIGCTRAEVDPRRGPGSCAVTATAPPSAAVLPSTMDPSVITAKAPAATSSAPPRQVVLNGVKAPVALLPRRAADSDTSRPVPIPIAATAPPPSSARLLLSSTRPARVTEAPRRARMAPPKRAAELLTSCDPPPTVSVALCPSISMQPPLPSDISPKKAKFAMFPLALMFCALKIDTESIPEI